MAAPVTAVARSNNADDATDLQGQIHAIGSVTVSSGTATAMVDGTIPDMHAINGWDNGALYAKHVLTGDFDASVRVDSFHATSDKLEAFFAVQSGLHGGRLQVHGATGTATHATAMGGGVINSGGGADHNTMRVVRTGGMLYAGFGTDMTKYAAVTADDVPLVVAIGIDAEHYPGGEATGTATAIFSNFVVTQPSGDCFAAGFE